MEVVLIRHTSVDVPAGVCYGRTDVPLKAGFEEEAARTKHELQALGAFDHVFSSPLSRCLRLAAYCGFPHPQQDNRLLELDFGDWEMKSFDEITDSRLQAWFDDYLHVAPTNGEAFSDQIRRVGDFLDELKEKDYGRVAVFAHGGVLLSAQIHVGALTIEKAFESITPFGGIISITI